MININPLSCISSLFWSDRKLLPQNMSELCRCSGVSALCICFVEHPAQCGYLMPPPRSHDHCINCNCKLSQVISHDITNLMIATFSTLCIALSILDKLDFTAFCKQECSWEKGNKDVQRKGGSMYLARSIFSDRISKMSKNQATWRRKNLMHSQHSCLELLL